MSKPTVTEQEFKEWLEHPVTKALRQMAEANREAFKETWATGGFTATEGYVKAVEEARVLGMIQVLDSLIKIEYEDILGDIFDGKPIGT